MRCRVLDGGLLKSKSHVNLPGIRINLPPITQKDHRDIIFGIEKDVDYIALSFVREAADISQLKNLLGEKKGKIKPSWTPKSKVGKLTKNQSLSGEFLHR